MRETPEELKELQALLDDSLSRSTTHLRSIINTERTLTAEQLTQVITGMCTLALSTVTAKGEPRISGVDGHFLHGKWHFGTARGAAKARHLAARPAVSAAHMRGEDLGVFTYGTVEISTPTTRSRPQTGRTYSPTSKASTVMTPSTGTTTWFTTGCIRTGHRLRQRHRKARCGDPVLIQHRPHRNQSACPRPWGRIQWSRVTRNLESDTRVT
ncbi:hypothetical protein MLGJGCBP_04720 [Rhodococcus sp. T7]|nr:hypothetical protein MLGJGCBP_09262 [Rhodococcus sp. T7]KAF0962099.1 hypothetical protein MLGJGCBP_04720 [Rhodococcus sp. T7]